MAARHTIAQGDLDAAIAHLQNEALKIQVVIAVNLSTRQLMQAGSDSTQLTILMGSVLVGMAPSCVTRVFAPWLLARSHKKGMLSFFSPLMGIQMGMLPCLMENNGYQTLSKTAYTRPQIIKRLTRLMLFTVGHK